MKYLSYWVLPIISGIIWIATLLSLLLYWIIDTNSRHYPAMEANTNIAEISDVAAFTLKPLFITGCSLTAVFLDLSFLADIWLRYRGRLVPKSTLTERILGWLDIIFAVAGTVGLILLSIFDNNTYPRLHDGFLLLFIAGYILNAIFVSWGFHLLGKHNRRHKVLRVGFWIKIVFIVVEIVLCAVFAATKFTGNENVSAVFEWIIAFIFSLYIFSYVVDLYPAIYTKQGARFRHSGLNGPTDEDTRRVEEAMEHHRFAGPLIQLRHHPSDSASILTEGDPNPRFAGVGRNVDERVRSSHSQRPISMAGHMPSNF